MAGVIVRKPMRVPQEAPYVFISVDPLLDDFLADVAEWKGS